MNVDVEDWPRPHRLTVREYHRMAEVGLLSRDARVELIEGEIIDMAPIGSRHAVVVDLLAESLIEAAKRSALVRTQGPVRLSRYSEPEPDIALLERHVGRYLRSHPTAEDVLLIVEVSDTTLRFDREVKAGLYARHAIPEYWVVDLNDNLVHVLRDPNEGSYGTTLTVSGGVLRVAALPIEINVSKVLKGSETPRT
jgi:Uma2 family endonuclease